MGAFESKKLGETRALGTVAGDLERQARRLSDKGYRREAGSLMGQAAIERASKRGFDSADADIQNEKLGLGVRQTVMDGARKAILGDTQGGSMMQEARAAATPASRLDATPASRLGASPTPGLDASAATDPRQTTTRLNASPTPPAASPTPQSFADIQTSKTREATMAGNFGSAAKAQMERGDNIKQRQSLFAEMRASLADGTDMKRKDEFAAKAATLGVAPDRFSATMGQMQYDDFTKDVKVKPDAQAPRFGADVARKNLATMGAEGAAADYFARSRADEAAKQNQGIDRAFAKPVSYQGSPEPKPTGRAAPPAAANTVNPLRVGAPERPTPSVLSGVRDMIAGSEKESFGGKMNLTPRAQKPLPVFSGGTTIAPKLSVNQKADIQERKAAEIEAKRVSLIDEARQKKRDSLRLRGFEGSIAEEVYRSLGSGKWSDNPK